MFAHCVSCESAHVTGGCASALNVGPCRSPVGRAVGPMCHACSTNGDVLGSFCVVCVVSVNIQYTFNLIMSIFYICIQ